MAVPTVQAVGSGTGVAGVDLTVTLPAHAADDILITAVECANDAMTCPTSGWAELPDSPQQAGSVGQVTRLTVFWKRATSGAETNPVIQGSTNHAYGFAINIRGCITTGNPWDVTSGGNTGATSDTSLSATGDTSTVAECLILYLACRQFDSSTAQYSVEADATLTSVAENFDAGTSTGNGGGLGAWTGTKATAGAYGPLTATLANASPDGFVSIALKPPTPGGATEDPFPYVGGGYYPVEG